MTPNDSNTNDKNEAKVKKIRRIQECAARLKKATRVLLCFKTSSQNGMKMRVPTKKFKFGNS